MGNTHSAKIATNFDKLKSSNFYDMNFRGNNSFRKMILEKKIRDQLQINDIKKREAINLTRARMLEISQQQNITQQKLAYSLIAFIFIVIILMVTIMAFKN